MTYSEALQLPNTKILILIIGHYLNHNLKKKLVYFLFIDNIFFIQHLV